MHKKNRIIITFGFLLFCMVFHCFCCPVSAKPKSYTIRIYGGKWGTVNGKSVYEKKYPMGTYFRFQDLKMVSKNEKYYIKGIRESGRDNNTVGLPGFLVQEDADYVLAFGIKGELVEYQVRYVDENGKELTKSDTYYGNVGDKPIVAYKYLEDYLPNARNITGTLKKDKKNVFQFVYSKVPQKSKTKETVQEEVVKEEKTIKASPQKTSVSEEETRETSSSPAKDTTSSTQEKDNTQTSEDSQKKIPDIYNIDDDQTPKSQYSTENKENQEPIEISTGTPISKIIPYVLLIVFVLLFLLFLLIKRKNQKE